MNIYWKLLLQKLKTKQKKLVRKYLHTVSRHKVQKAIDKEHYLTFLESLDYFVVFFTKLLLNTKLYDIMIINSIIMVEIKAPFNPIICNKVNSTIILKMVEKIVIFIYCSFLLNENINCFNAKEIPISAGINSPIFK